MERNLILLSFLIGNQGVYWIPCLIDEVEWTDPAYYHQN